MSLSPGRKSSCVREPWRIADTKHRCRIAAHSSANLLHAARACSSTLLMQGVLIVIPRHRPACGRTGRPLLATEGIRIFIDADVGTVTLRVVVVSDAQPPRTQLLPCRKHIVEDAKHSSVEVARALNLATRNQGVNRQTVKAGHPRELIDQHHPATSNERRLVNRSIVHARSLSPVPALRRSASLPLPVGQAHVRMLHVWRSPQAEAPAVRDVGRRAEVVVVAATGSACGTSPPPLEPPALESP